jgi:hypothetical protein
MPWVKGVTTAILGQFPPNRVVAVPVFSVDSLENGMLAFKG